MTKIFGEDFLCQITSSEVRDVFLSNEAARLNVSIECGPDLENGFSYRYQGWRVRNQYVHIFIKGRSYAFVRNPVSILNVCEDCSRIGISRRVRERFLGSTPLQKDPDLPYEGHQILCLRCWRKKMLANECFRQATDLHCLINQLKRTVRHAQETENDRRSESVPL